MAFKTGNPRSGAPDGSSLGLSTGKTIHGNTAYGPSGGMAAGYATRDGFGNLGNFKSLNGAPMSGMYGQVTGPAPRLDAEGRPVKEATRMPGGWNPAPRAMPGGWNPAAGFSALGAAFGNPFSALRGFMGFGRYDNNP
jgi:hypothetical protein